MGQNRQIKLGALFSYVAIFINIFVGLLYTPWIKNRIGIEQYGLYTLANSVISLFMVDFGLSSAVTRYLSKFSAEKNEKKASQFLGALYKLYFLLDIIIFVILTVVYFLIEQIYIKLSPQELILFKGVYIISGAFALINFPFVTHNGILNSYEKFVQLKLIDIIYRILVVVLTVITLSNGGGLYALVICNAVSGLVIILIKFAVIRKAVPLRADFSKTDKRLYKEIFGFSVWVTISTLAHRMVFNITPSVLGAVANSTAIAIFGIVSTIEGYVYQVTSAINGMFMPRISRIYAGNGEEHDIMPLMLRVGRFQYALNALIVVGFSVVGKDFITLWMGKEFADAYFGVLLIIIPGMFFNALQIAVTAMTVKKKVKLQAYINMAMGLTNIVLSLLLSKYYGALGACISISIAYALRVIILNVVLYKLMNINMVFFIQRCYLQMLPAILLSLVVGYGTYCFIPVDGWLGLCIKSVFVTCVYGVSMFTVGLQKEERRQLLCVIKKR